MGDDDITAVAFRMSVPMFDYNNDSKLKSKKKNRLLLRERERKKEKKERERENLYFSLQYCNLDTFLLTSGLEQELGESPNSRPSHCSAGDHRVVSQGALPFAGDGLRGAGRCGGLRVVRGRGLHAGQTGRRRRGVGDGRLLR